GQEPPVASKPYKSSKPSRITQESIPGNKPIKPSEDKPVDVSSRQSNDTPRPTSEKSFDETTGFLHKASGVGFVYPADWENLGVTQVGPITQLGLRKDAMEVTLYWSPLPADTEPAKIGELEAGALLPLYHDRLSEPERARVGDQSGYKLYISGGPLGLQ